MTAPLPAKSAIEREKLLSARETDPDKFKKKNDSERRGEGRQSVDIQMHSENQNGRSKDLPHNKPEGGESQAPSQ